MPDQTQRAIQRQIDPLRRGSGPRVDTHDGTIKVGIGPRGRQTFGSRTQIDNQRQLSLTTIGQPHDAQSPHLQQSRQHVGTPNDTPANIDLIIRNQFETTTDQTKRQIRFPRPGRSDQQNGVTASGHARPVNAPINHGGNVIPRRSKRKWLVGLQAACNRRFIMISRNTIATAANLISRYVRRTPILQITGRDLGLTDQPDLPIVLKLELLQHAGSFKPRGAFNRMLSEPPPPAGVIAASGGNHGAAVAYAARALSVTAEIFVPGPTPAAKVARIASYGARVVQGGETYAEALAASRDRQAQTGAMEVHAYDHPAVLAGQGTAAREFELDAPDLTHILVATGGGGLIGGVAAWYAGSASLISVEPEGCPTLHDALRAGHPVPAPVGGLAADSLGARQVGAWMFPIAQQYVAEAVLVPDQSIRAAQKRLWEACRIVTEPGGATATAALISGRFRPPSGARIGILVCGGNTDPAAVATVEAITSAPPN